MWRGLILAKALEQFLVDVSWGDLDYLLIDMPPGHGRHPDGAVAAAAADRDARRHDARGRRAEGRGTRRRHGAALVPEGARRRREHDRVRRARRHAPRDLRCRRRQAPRRAHGRAARRVGADRARGLAGRRRGHAGGARAPRRAGRARAARRSRNGSSPSSCRRSRWPVAPPACSSWSRSSREPRRTRSSPCSVDDTCSAAAGITRSGASISRTMGARLRRTPVPQGAARRTGARRPTPMRVSLAVQDAVVRRGRREDRERAARPRRRTTSGASRRRSCADACSASPTRRSTRSTRPGRAGGRRRRATRAACASRSSSTRGERGWRADHWSLARRLPSGRYAAAPSSVGESERDRGPDPRRRARRARPSPAACTRTCPRRAARSCRTGRGTRAVDPNASVSVIDQAQTSASTVPISTPSTATNADSTTNARAHRRGLEARARAARRPDGGARARPAP